MGCYCDGNVLRNLIPVYTPVTSEKTVRVTAGEGITVVDNSTSEMWDFDVSLKDYTALSVALTLVAKELGVIKSSPILKGTVIDELELTWTTNKDITSQTLSNNGGLISPTLVAADRAHEYTTQDVQSDISFTLQGNDGEGESGSIDSDSASISFGNYMWIGHGTSRIGLATSGLEAFLESLATSTIKTARAHSYFATGGANQKHFIAYPKAWGLATFTKGIFAGGYIRLKNVAGTLVTDAGVDPETDITITNSKGHSEAYYVYESLYDNQADAITPFIIS